VRCGEAVLLVFALFLLLIASQAATSPAPKPAPGTVGTSSGLVLLPAIALLGGMLIKSFEQLVFGLADRLFKAAEVFFPPTPAPAPSVAPARISEAKIKTALDRWLLANGAKLPKPTATSWVLVDPKAAEFWLIFGSPADAKTAAAQLQPLLAANLPVSVKASSLLIHDDAATSRVYVTIDDSALLGLADASASTTNPWP